MQRGQSSPLYLSKRGCSLGRKKDKTQSCRSRRRMRKEVVHIHFFSPHTTTSTTTATTTTAVDYLDSREVGRCPMDPVLDTKNNNFRLHVFSAWACTRKNRTKEQKEGSTCLYFNRSEGERVWKWRSLHLDVRPLRLSFKVPQLHNEWMGGTPAQLLYLAPFSPVSYVSVSFWYRHTQTIEPCSCFLGSTV